MPFRKKVPDICFFELFVELYTQLSIAFPRAPYFLFIFASNKNKFQI